MAFDEIDIQMTRRSLELAAAGAGLVSPNPLVGCVILSGGEIVGEGTYVYDGIEHAEAIALKQAGARARGATAYVSLEPHHHVGRTPPCTEALINAGIVRVVSPIEDPNPLVSGRGFARLREAGVEVVTGILAEEASRLNEKFICWHRKGRPFVHLKMAMSLDGRIAREPGRAYKFTGPEGTRRVHEIRHEYDSILIGANTARIDDPILTDRSGLPRRRPLVRVVLSGEMAISASSRLAATAEEQPVVLFTRTGDDAVEPLRRRGVSVKELPNGPSDLHSVLSDLRSNEVQSVLVEGGATVAGSFLNAGLVDKVSFFYSSEIIGGPDAPPAVRGHGPLEVRLEGICITEHGRDIELVGYPSYERDAC